MAASKKTEKMCLNCGRKFSSYSSWSEKYCGQDCYHAAPKHRIPVSDRFWPKVRKTDTCWEWTGGMKGPGRNRYGVLRTERGKESAHRISWELHFGPIPLGKWVLHHCDNPPCVRPDHLFLGTNAENMADMNAKGRHGVADKRGIKHHMAKLNEAQVREIRQSYVPFQRHCVPKLAAKFGVSRQAIYGILYRYNWSHLA